MLCFSLGSRVRGNDGGSAGMMVLNPLLFPLGHQGGGIHRKVDFVRRRASFQPAMRRMRSLWDMSGS